MVSQVNNVAGAQKPLAPFTEIKYETKDGEKCTATKDNGVVTIKGDKNGVRQMPVEEFLSKELLENVKPLENAPAKDTAEIAGKTVEAPKEEVKADEKAEGKKLDAVA